MIDIERLKVDADYWDEVAPDGATHYNTLSKQWFAVFDRVKAMRFDGEMWSPVKDCSVTLNFGGSEVIKRPQPSTASLLTDAQAEARMGELVTINDTTDRVMISDAPNHKPAKNLDQSVFNDAATRYRWAAVNADGCVWLHQRKPELRLKRPNPMWSSYADEVFYVGFGYNATNWKCSLIERKASEPHDPVNSPSHYASGGIECIDAMQAMLSRDEFIGYLRGNIFKYQWRYKLKNGVEDLKKAQWYQNKLIEVESK